MPILPLCSNPKFSNENAEKVVKPPQIPVARNNFQLSEILSSLILMANTSPIIKQPMIFTDSVANGNSFDLINKDVPYLIIEPRLPPKPTSNKFFIIGFMDLREMCISNLSATSLLFLTLLKWLYLRGDSCYCS